jgi:hypothetical protein
MASDCLGEEIVGFTVDRDGFCGLKLNISRAVGVKYPIAMRAVEKSQ